MRICKILSPCYKSVWYLSVLKISGTVRMFHMLGNWQFKPVSVKWDALHIDLFHKYIIIYNLYITLECSFRNNVQIYVLTFSFLKISRIAKILESSWSILSSNLFSKLSIFSSIDCSLFALSRMMRLDGPINSFS